MRRLRAAGAALVSAMLAACSSIAWRPATFSVEACVSQAKLAVRDADFTEHLSIVAYAAGTIVSGRHGSYWARIDCSAAQQAVQVAVAGPDPELNERYRNFITRKF